MHIPPTDAPQADTDSELPDPQTAAGPALRVLRHPEEIAALADAWDSLAEGYMNSGDKPHAIEFYEKSITLNPRNDNAVAQLKKLNQPAADTAKP